MDTQKEKYDIMISTLEVEFLITERNFLCEKLIKVC